MFLEALFSMNSWDTSGGGKSESKFMISAERLFVLKRFTNNKEFFMFRKFACDYFKHMWKSIYEGKPSILSRIYGMFEVREKHGVGYYLVMENLFQGLP
jgi:hypothetical protein